MRIALISDIHANREAFEACLDHARRNAIDEYVFLGDYVGYGADPGWVVDLVMAHVERGAIAVLGNHDAAAVGQVADMNEDAATAIEWAKTKLAPSRASFSAGCRSRHGGATIYTCMKSRCAREWGLRLRPLFGVALAGVDPGPCDLLPPYACADPVPLSTTGKFAGFDRLTGLGFR